jgi:hypothetical protein
MLSLLSLRRHKEVWVFIKDSNGSSEIDALNFIDKTAIEKVHLGFCKSTLGVKKSSTNLAVRVELGRLPLESFIKVHSRNSS